MRCSPVLVAREEKLKTQTRTIFRITGAHDSTGVVPMVILVSRDKIPAMESEKKGKGERKGRREKGRIGSGVGVDWGKKRKIKGSLQERNKYARL